MMLTEHAVFPPPARRTAIRTRPRDDVTRLVVGACALEVAGRAPRQGRAVQTRRLEKKVHIIKLRKK